MNPEPPLGVPHVPRPPPTDIQLTAKILVSYCVCTLQRDPKEVVKATCNLLPLLAYPSTVDYTFVQDFVTKFIVQKGTLDLWCQVVDFSLSHISMELEAAIKGNKEADMRVLVVLRELLQRVLPCARGKLDGSRGPLSPA